MSPRVIDLDQLFVAVLEHEPWSPDLVAAALRAGRRRQRRAQALVLAGTAVVVAAVLLALPGLGLLRAERPGPVVVAGPPAPALPPDAPLAILRPAPPGEFTARLVRRDGQDWVMAAGDVLGPGGERVSGTPGELRAAVLSTLWPRFGQKQVAAVVAAAGSYQQSIADGRALAWANTVVTRPGQRGATVRTGLWLSHPASWEGCGVGEVECTITPQPDLYVSEVSYRTVQPDTAGLPVTTWWVRASLHNGLFATVSVEAPLTRDDALTLAKAVITLTY